jgi:hypothetical protein
VFAGIVLDHKISYWECPVCLYLQTEEPHWLTEAYEHPINHSDTGILVRNSANTYKTLATIWALGIDDPLVVDVAGGYGILVRMLRDVGVTALWTDPYSENLFARGFELDDVDPGNRAGTLVTAFEAFEHFEDPAESLTSMLNVGDSVLISTDLAPRPAPAPREWWYYGSEHGQHIGFFRERTFQHFASVNDLRFYSDGSSYHLLTARELSRTRWLSAIKLSRFAKPLLARRFGSLTWSDHDLHAVT